ncbi:MAG: PEP-CTERM sorting domain-containing protein, partial [bacterium]
MKATKILESLTKTVTVLTVCAAVEGGAGARAALIAYESFDYTADANLANQGSSGDDGWADGWTDSGSVTSPGVDYTDSNSDSLVVAGNKANLAGTSKSATAFRDFESALTPTADNPIWISLIMESNTSNSRFFALSLIDSDGKVASSIGTDDTSDQQWRLSGGDPLAADVVTGSDAQNKAFLMAKYTATGSELFVNPDLDAEPTTADVSISFTSIAAFDRVRLFAGDDNNNPADADFDEIRIGDSFSDVATPIPEPTSFALLVLGGLALLKRRPRRA